MKQQHPILGTKVNRKWDANWFYVVTRLKLEQNPARAHLKAVLGELEFMCNKHDAVWGALMVWNLHVTDRGNGTHHRICVLASKAACWWDKKTIISWRREKENEEIFSWHKVYFFLRTYQQQKFVIMCNLQLLTCRMCTGEKWVSVVSYFSKSPAAITLLWDGDSVSTGQSLLVRKTSHRRRRREHNGDVRLIFISLSQTVKCARKTLS